MNVPPGRKTFYFSTRCTRAVLAVRVTSGGGKTYLAHVPPSAAEAAHPSPGAPTLARARSAAAKISGRCGAGPRSGRRPQSGSAGPPGGRHARRPLKLAAAASISGASYVSPTSAESYATRKLCARSRLPSPSNCALPAADFDRATAVKILDGLTKDGKPAMAARTAAYARACYQWAIRGRGSIEANPFAALPINPTVKRERVLTDAELRAIWQARLDQARQFRIRSSKPAHAGRRSAVMRSPTWRGLSLSDDRSRHGRESRRAGRRTASRQHRTRCPLGPPSSSDYRGRSSI